MKNLKTLIAAAYFIVLCLACVRGIMQTHPSPIALIFVVGTIFCFFSAALLMFRFAFSDDEEDDGKPGFWEKLLP